MHKKFENKLTHKSKMINRFVNAARIIIDNESIDNITIRRVADLAGYNSATLYKYFDDLNHLKFISAMTYLDKYIEDIPKYVKNTTNCKEIYVKIWDCYIDHSFDIPNIYYSLFFSNLKSNMDQYVKEYYNIYPLIININNDSIIRMLLSPSLSTRSKILMSNCISSNLFDEELGYIADDIVICVYESYLSKVKKKIIDTEKGKEITKSYIREILNRFSY